MARMKKPRKRVDPMLPFLLGANLALGYALSLLGIYAFLSPVYGGVFFSLLGAAMVSFSTVRLVRLASAR